MKSGVYRRMVGAAALVAAVAGMVLAVGCGSEAEEGTIRIGVIVPLSGNLSPLGSSTLEGIEYRVEQINAAGGIDGRMLTLKVEDNRGDQSQSISAFKKLTGLGGVTAVIGPITSTNALAVANPVTQAGVPTVTPTATNDQVAPASPFLFRACFKDSFQGEVVAQYALGQGITSAATMTELSSDYSIGLVRSFMQAFRKGGGTIAAEVSYQEKDTEFGPQLSQIKESGAKLVFVPGYPGEVPLILKQAKVMGLAATFCGADGWDHQDIIQQSGDQIVGAFFSGAFSPEDQREIVQNFVTAMTARTGTEPGSFEALGADSVTLIVEAIKAAGSTEATAVRDAMTRLEKVTTVTGPITMTADGDARKSAVVMGVVKAGDGYDKKYLATIQP